MSDEGAPLRPWRPAPPAVDLDPTQVHVWRSPSRVGDVHYEAHLARLDAGERTRLAHLRHRERRREFVVSRGLLRCALGRALRCDPRGLRFVIGAHGKPAPAPGWPRSDVVFNVSHTFGQVLVAIGTRHALGVDVQHHRSGTQWRPLARRFFSPAERHALAALPEERQRTGFFACWSRKEALIKAHGAGVGVGLASFDVNVDPEAEALVLALRGDQWPPLPWCLFDLPIGPGYSACLARAEAPERICCWEAC